MRLSTAISEIYRKYQPQAEKVGAKLSLELNDAAQETVDDMLAPQVEKQLASAIKRSKQSKITLSVQKGCIIISDSDTVLSKSLCKLLSSSRITVKSRVGFGTKITIKTSK